MHEKKLFISINKNKQDMVLSFPSRAIVSIRISCFCCQLPLHSHSSAFPMLLAKQYFLERGSELRGKDSIDDLQFNDKQKIIICHQD